MSAAPLHPDDRRARQEAAAWLVKHDRGLSAVEQDEFFQWLAADPQHGAWFSRHRGGWHRLDGIAAWRPEHSAEPNPDVLARPRRVPAWVRPAVAALAACVVLGVGLAFWSDRDSASALTAPVALPVATDGYERRQLDDGSVLELNRGATVDVSYSATERRIALRGGEALFTVAKDPRRPFIVRAGGVEVRAVGTAFNVRLASGEVEVLVTEGRVQVAPRSTQATATPPLVVEGQRAVVALTADAVPQIEPASANHLARVRAWQPQLLDFSSTPLSEVIAELNRRNRIQLVLEDPASAAVPIVASIRSDNLDGFVSLVTAAAGLRAERRGDYEIVLMAAR
jgi:transmembrane sensor